MEAIDFLYNLAKKDGFNGSLDKFIDLANSDENVFKKVYEYAKSTGYNKSEEDFLNVIGGDKNKKKYGKRKDVTIDPGYLEDYRTVSTGSEEYRSAYNEGRVMPVDEEGMPVQVSSEVTVTADKPEWMVKKESNPALAYIPNDVWYEKVVKPYADTFDPMRRDVVKELVDLYSSKAFRKKWEKEKYMSNKMGDDVTDDVIDERIMRLKKTPGKFDSELEKEAEALGMMSSEIDFDKIKKGDKKIPLKTSVRVSDDKNRTTEENISTIREEYVHAEHQKEAVESKDLLTEGRRNITKYARHINKKYNQSKIDYLNKDTEAYAKKRAAELWLADQGKITPGEFADDSHYEYLLQNYENLPNSVKHFIMITTGDDEDKIKDLSEMAKAKAFEDKHNAKGGSKINVWTSEFNKRTEKFKKAFKAFMNEVAAADKTDKNKNIV